MLNCWPRRSFYNPAGERHLAMFSAYLDESGKGAERNAFLAVGGLVSSALQWGRLERDWRKCLLSVDGMPLDSDGRPVPFHMTDFVSDNWPIRKYQWRSEKSKEAFLNRLINVMCRRIKLRVFTVVVLQEYHTIFPKDPKKKWPWTLSALGCASRISQWGQSQNCIPIPFIFEQGGEGWSLAYKNHCLLKKSGRLSQAMIGSWTMADKHVAGLQAADIWAWEMRRHFKSQVAGELPRLRPSLKKLVYCVPDGRGFVLDGYGLNMLMEDFRKGTATVPICEFSPRSLPAITEDGLNQLRRHK
jgi:hypothetical protein